LEFLALSFVIALIFWLISDMMPEKYLENATRTLIVGAGIIFLLMIGVPLWLDKDYKSFAFVTICNDLDCNETYVRRYAFTIRGDSVHVMHDTPTGFFKYTTYFFRFNGCTTIDRDNWYCPEVPGDRWGWRMVSGELEIPEKPRRKVGGGSQHGFDTLFGNEHAPQ